MSGNSFERESDMTAVAVDWLRSQDLLVKQEFISPWGKCDLVGLHFNVDRVKQRVCMQQSRAVTSIQRASVLLGMPDETCDHCITAEQLSEKFQGVLAFPTILDELGRLASDKFVVRKPDGFQKRNGWMPLQSRLVAVELKLSRIEEALQQAQTNLGFASESYAAFPFARAARIAASPGRWSSYLERGVGVLGLTKSKCEVLVCSKPPTDQANEVVQFYCVEKFWKLRPTSNLS